MMVRLNPLRTGQKTTGSSSDADPESTPAWASVPENSCVTSFSGMDSGSAYMACALNSQDAPQRKTSRKDPGRPE